jgi:hypothetical protein
MFIVVNLSRCEQAAPAGANDLRPGVVVPSATLRGRLTVDQMLTTINKLWEGEGV